MAYNFKNLSEVERQDKPTENTTVMAFESGNPRQIPASEFGGKGLVVDLRSYTVSEGSPLTIEDMSYDPIYEAISAGQNVIFQMQSEGIEWFTQPMLSFLLPEGFVPEGSGPKAGFIVICEGINNQLSILFTNGSYHTTA